MIGAARPGTGGKKAAMMVASSGSATRVEASFRENHLRRRSFISGKVLASLSTRSPKTATAQGTDDVTDRPFR